MTVYPEVAEPIAAWLAGRHGAPVEIAELRRHVEGFSWQTYTLLASWTDPETGSDRSRGYAVRREPEDGLLAPYDIEQQFRIHRAVVDHSDVPMPDLFWLETDPSVLGMPFYVMERVEGVVPIQWRGNDPEIFPDDAARHAIGLDFVDVLARIHAIDVDAAGLRDLGPETDPEAATRREIDTWERFYEESYLLEVPLLRFLIGWLRRNIVSSGQVGLVHGDFRIGNFMLGSDRRINAVFDWELAYVGDPAFDLAWAGMPLFRGRSPLISQLLDKDEFFERYEAHTGVRITEEVYRFWTLFGHLRASAPHLRACRAFEEGRTNDLRLAAMGHQNLYILRQLADQLGWRGGSMMQNSLERIFEGIAASLRESVLPALTDPYLRSQVTATIELIGNLGSRVQWRTDQIDDLVGRIREALGAEGADLPAPTGDPVEDRRAHLAALAAVCDGEISDAVQDLLMEDLRAELDRLKTGMYR